VVANDPDIKRGRMMIHRAKSFPDPPAHTYTLTHTLLSLPHTYTHTHALTHSRPPRRALCSPSLIVTALPGQSFPVLQYVPLNPKP